MIDKIYKLLKDLDPMERDRIMNAASRKLDDDRQSKLDKAKAEVFKFEKK